MSEEYTAYQNAKSNAESYNNDVDTHAYLELFAKMKDIVHIYAPRIDIKDLKTMKPAKVGWGSIQPVTPDEAREFARIIIKAADEADRLNKDCEGK